MKGGAAGGRRLGKELTALQKKPLEWCSVDIKGDDMYTWNATLHGPVDSPYEKGFFKMEITVPPEYPFKCPKPIFTTKVYHCNVNEKGEICLGSIETDWSPQTKIQDILIYVHDLLREPDPEHALLPDRGNQYKEDPKGYKKKAREWTKKFAKKDK